jgi:hypothetical protein
MGNIIPRPVPVPIPIPVKYHHRVAIPVVTVFNELQVVEPGGALGHVSVLVIPAFGQYVAGGQSVQGILPVGEYVPG